MSCKNYKLNRTWGREETSTCSNNNNNNENYGLTELQREKIVLKNINISNKQLKALGYCIKNISASN